MAGNDDVLAGATVQHVRSAVTDQHIVAGTPCQHIVAGAADKHVAAITTIAGKLHRPGEVRRIDVVGAPETALMTRWSVEVRIR